MTVFRVLLPAALVLVLIAPAAIGNDLADIELGDAHIKETSREQSKNPVSPGTHESVTLPARTSSIDYSRIKLKPSDSRSPDPTLGLFENIVDDHLKATTNVHTWHQINFTNPGGSVSDGLIIPNTSPPILLLPPPIPFLPPRR